MLQVLLLPMTWFVQIHHQPEWSQETAEPQQPPPNPSHTPTHTQQQQGPQAVS
jgi:hypothetical protein